MKTTPTIHPYASDGISPLIGDPWCICGRPKKHPAHDLPDVSDAVRVEQARRMGEATE